MAELKMPELNSVIVAGNLTKDPTFRETSNGTPVVNFHVAVNRRYKDSGNQWQEDVCYVGVVAWNKLADSCKDRLKKGSAVLIDGELQSRTFKTEDNRNRTIVEIKAKRIQFLNKLSRSGEHKVIVSPDAEQKSDTSITNDKSDKAVTNDKNIDNVTEVNKTEDNATKDKATKDNATKDNATKDNATKDSYEDNSFDKFLTDEESNLINEDK